MNIDEVAGLPRKIWRVMYLGVFVSKRIISATPIANYLTVYVRTLVPSLYIYRVWSGAPERYRGVA